MDRVTASMKGGQALLAGLRRKAAAAGPAGRKAFFTAAGRHMVTTEIPLIFREHGPGWRNPKMRNGEPLLDSGHLRDSITFKATKDDLLIGTTLKYGGIHQRGGTIVPRKGKYLALPLSPPLSPSEARTKGPRDFPGAFVLVKGPEGPGLYRKARGLVTAHNRFSGGASKYSRRSKLAGAVGIERIFAFMKSVRIPKREYLKWTTRALTALGRMRARMVGTA